MKIDKLGEKLWATLPQDQRQANITWLKQVCRQVKTGGIWAWPETGRVFKKVGENELEEITLSKK
jgi:hypothetical protein